MKYVVIEMQTYIDGTFGNLSWMFDDYNQAASKFHSVLTNAAISNLPVHTCVLLGNEGTVFDVRAYQHPSNVNDK